MGKGLKSYMYIIPSSPPIQTVIQRWTEFPVYTEGPGWLLILNRAFSKSVNIFKSLHIVVRSSNVLLFAAEKYSIVRMNYMFNHLPAD